VAAQRRSSFAAMDAIRDPEHRMSRRSTERNSWLSVEKNGRKIEGDVWQEKNKAFLSVEGVEESGERDFAEQREGDHRVAMGSVSLKGSATRDPAVNTKESGTSVRNLKKPT